MSGGIHAVDLHRSARIHHAQRGARLGPRANQAQPSVGAEQPRVEIAVDQTMILGDGGHEFTSTLNIFFASRVKVFAISPPATLDTSTR